MDSEDSKNCSSSEPMFLEVLVRSAITDSSPKLSHTRDSDGPFMVNFERTGKLGGIYWNYLQAWRQVPHGRQSNFG
jgi:hypothetical protein